MNDSPIQSEDTAAPHLPPVEGESSAPNPDDRTAAASGHRPSYVFLGVVSVLSCAADVSSKLWAVERLKDPPGKIEIIPNHLALILAHNPGGAWGLFHDASESVRRPFFLFVTVAAIAFIVSLYRKLRPDQAALKWGLPLVLGGALGNLFDRIRLKYVIDFIDAHIVVAGVDHHWPTFNVADIAICVGVGLMALDVFATRKREGAAV